MIMEETIAIVACSSLRPTIESIDPTVKVEYIPHELHESPIDPGDENAALDQVQSAIDLLSKPHRPYIGLAYARSCSSLRKAVSRETPIVAWRAGDCVDALCDRPLGRFGEAKQPNTYYLTPGSIEAGIDPYKCYLAYRGETDQLVESQRAAGLAPTWHDANRLSSTAISAGRPGEDLLRSQFEVLVGGYTRVVLLDTGVVGDPHRAYAHQIGEFLGELGGRPLEVEVQEADLTSLEQLIGGGSLDDETVDIAQPGTPLGDIEPQSTRPHPSPVPSHD